MYGDDGEELTQICPLLLDTLKHSLSKHGILMGGGGGLAIFSHWLM